jgi:hypothetical protein
MPELIRNAWIGWQDYKEAGKFAVLLMALYLFLFIIKNSVCTDIRKPNLTADDSEKGNNRIRTLYIYTGIIAVLCIFPLTAAVLMLYQTKFYNYEWIWSYVPMTCVLSVGACTVLELVWRKNYKASDRIKALVITMLLAGVLLVSGSINVWSDGQEENTQTQSCESTAALVESIEKMTDNTICLWATQDIMAHAREYSADVTLIYGRNMWDNALNAYSYDTYTKEYEDMYQWMQLMELCGEISVVYGSEDVDYDNCIQNAIDAGVNVIVLPENTMEEALSEIEETAGAQSVIVEGYYVILI